LRWRVFWLRHVDGVKSRRVAEAVGRPVEWVYQALYKVGRRLEAAYDEEPRDVG